jgi:hypothetical protein
VLEELADDRFLVAEVVVEVARADAQGGGNVVGGDIALPLFVEERLALQQYPVAGLHVHCSWG